MIFPIAFASISSTILRERASVVTERDVTSGAINRPQKGKRNRERGIEKERRPSSEPREDSAKEDYRWLPPVIPCVSYPFVNAERTAASSTLRRLLYRGVMETARYAGIPPLNTAGPINIKLAARTSTFSSHAHVRDPPR